MIISKEEISSWDSKYRLKFINSVSGYKGVHLIGTKSKDGRANLGIFNSIVHISSEPARIGFIMRPITTSRDTYNNIIETSSFTINHVHKSFLEQAHFTSANFEPNQSEFVACNLKEEYNKEFSSPFVAESNVKIGLKLIEDIEIKANNCRLIIGEVQFVGVKEDYLEEDGQLDFEKAQSVCVTGLNQYSSVTKLVNHPYARTKDLPNFRQKKRPDNIVFEEETQSYNASLLPYGTSVGAPSISASNLPMWKSSGITSFNHVLKNKVDKIKEEYETLVDEYKINELLYSAKYEFEPIIGETYHLYEKDNKSENFLSLVPPNTWKKTHIGSFRVNSDKVWNKIEE
jgi:flavin reductase (DIM6/NTAB) family NADH-FMN oxidoreductase RutF